MTHPAEKLWGRLLLVALCAVLAAGGAFFASCFAYGRSWRTGGSRDFEDSEFAAAYVADCMGYLMDCYTYQNVLPTEAAARGYGRGSFGCVLLCDGEPVFDTTADKAALLQSQSFFLYENIIAEGSLEDYTAALWYGPFEDPRYGTVVYAEPAGAESNGAASGEASGEADRVVLGIEHEYTLVGYLNYPIEPYGGLYAEYSFWQLMLALENWALPLAILCWALAAALAFTLARDALR